MLPRPPKLQLSSLPFRKQPAPPAGLDKARRWLHITNEYIVLEIEGESEGLLLSRELDSTASGGVRMRTFAPKPVAFRLRSAHNSAAFRSDGQAPTSTKVSPHHVVIGNLLSSGFAISSVSNVVDAVDRAYSGAADPRAM